MITDFNKLWEDALTSIELNISKANFATWFKNTHIINNKSGILVIGVPNTFVKEWLSTKYHKYIFKIIHDVHPEIKNVEYIISTRTAPAKIIEPEMPIIKPIEEDQLKFNEFCIDAEANLNPKYTFDSFIVGSFNEIAYAASLAVTKNLGTAYNPLFIYGGVGLGKTHLLQSIGNEIRKNNPDMSVFYMTSEKFANDFVNSMQSNTIQSFKDKYRKHNLLIIDDIQFFSDKLKIQEEFFHIFNSLYERNNQIIFSSDRSPQHIVGLEERLRSRFEGGMMVDIGTPGYESRLAILKSKIAEKDFPLEDKILEYIASVIQSNIRELEGALNSVIGQCKLRNRVLNMQEIKDLLKKNIKPTKIVTVNHVIKTIANFYDVEERTLFKKTRRKEVVLPRQIAMYILREDLSTSYPSIGHKFGQKDHTTVIHAYKKISNSMQNDIKLGQEIEQIREILYEKTV
jgi:chromosomal replication initiator protein